LGFASPARKIFGWGSIRSGAVWTGRHPSAAALQPTGLAPGLGGQVTPVKRLPDGSGWPGQMMQGE